MLLEGSSHWAPTLTHRLPLRCFFNTIVVLLGYSNEHNEVPTKVFKTIFLTHPGWSRLHIFNFMFCYITEAFGDEGKQQTSFNTGLKNGENK